MYSRPVGVAAGKASEQNTQVSRVIPMSLPRSVYCRVGHLMKEEPSSVGIS